MTAAAAPSALDQGGTRPKGLDLFCGAGGASMGYSRAGFDMTGVDIKPMPRYPFTFIQGDALEYVAAHGHEYDAIFASPPCQGYSAMRCLPWLKDREYPMLIEPTRMALEAVGKPWVIENVERAPLKSGVTLCGTMFGLKTYRHRRFESSVLLLAPPHHKHNVVIGSGRMLNDRAKPNAEGWVSLPGKATGKRMNGLRDNPNGMVVVAGHFSGQDAAREAMGIEWMSRDELAESIPPAYTQFIGAQIMAALTPEPRTHLTPPAPARTVDANPVFKLYAPVARCSKITDVWAVARQRYPHAEIHLSEPTVAALSGIDLGNVVVDTSVPNGNLWIKVNAR